MCLFLFQNNSSTSSPILHVPLAEAEDDSLSLSSLEDDSDSTCGMISCMKTSPITSVGITDINASTAPFKMGLTVEDDIEADKSDVMKEPQALISPIVKSEELNTICLPREVGEITKSSRYLEVEVKPLTEFTVIPGEYVSKQPEVGSAVVSEPGCIHIEPIITDDNLMREQQENIKNAKKIEIKTNSDSSYMPSNKYSVVIPYKPETKEVVRFIERSISTDAEVPSSQTKIEIVDSAKPVELKHDKIGKSHCHEIPKIFSFFKKWEHKKQQEQTADPNGSLNKTATGKTSGENDSLSSDSSKKGHKKTSSFLDRTRMAFHNMRTTHEKEYHSRTPTDKEEKMVADFMGRHPLEEESDRRRSKRFNRKSSEQDRVTQHITGVGFLGPRQVTNSNKHGLTLANLKRRFKLNKNTPEKVIEPEPVSPPWAQQYVGDIKEEYKTNVQATTTEEDAPPSYEYMTRSPAINNFEEALKQDLTISRVTAQKKARVHFNEKQLETTSYYYISDSDLSATSVDTLTAEETGLRESSDGVLSRSERQRTILKSLGNSIGGVGHHGDGNGLYLNKGITDDGCMFSFWSDKKCATSSPRLFRKPYSFNIIESDVSASCTNDKPAIDADSTIFYGKKGQRPNLKPLFTEDNCPIKYKPNVDLKVSNCDNNCPNTDEQSCDIIQTSTIRISKPVQHKKVVSPLRTQLACENSDATSSESINDSGYFQGSLDGDVSGKLVAKSTHKVDVSFSTDLKTDSINEHLVIPLRTDNVESGVGEITACYQSQSVSKLTSGPKQFSYLDDVWNNDAFQNEIKAETGYSGDADRETCTEAERIYDIMAQESSETTMMTSSSEQGVGKVTSNILKVSVSNRLGTTITRHKEPISSNREEMVSNKDDDSMDTNDTSTLMKSDGSCKMMTSEGRDVFQGHNDVAKQDADIHSNKTSHMPTVLGDLCDSACNSDRLSDNEIRYSLENCNNSNSNESLLDIDSEEVIVLTNSSTSCNFSICSSVLSTGNLSDISEHTQESSHDEDTDPTGSESSAKLMHIRKHKIQTGRTLSDNKQDTPLKKKVWKRLLVGGLGV